MTCVDILVEALDEKPFFSMAFGKERTILYSLILNVLIVDEIEWRLFCPKAGVFSLGGQSLMKLTPFEAILQTNFGL